MNEYLMGKAFKYELLINTLFDNSTISPWYDGLRFDDEKICDLLKIIERERYMGRLEDLKEISEKTQTICKVEDLNPGDIFKCAGEYFIKAYFDYDAFSLKSNRLGYFEPDDKVVKYDTAKLELN